MTKTKITIRRDARKQFKIVKITNPAASHVQDLGRIMTEAEAQAYIRDHSLAQRYQIELVNE